MSPQEEALAGIDRQIAVEKQAIKDYEEQGDAPGAKAARMILGRHEAYRRGLEFGLALAQPWINEQVRRPALCEPVLITVMRKAQLITSDEGGVKWHLRNSEHPIDLEKDVVYWLPDTQ